MIQVPAQSRKIPPSHTPLQSRKDAGIAAASMQATVEKKSAEKIEDNALLNGASG